MDETQNKIDAILKNLEASIPAHLEIGIEMDKADGGALYPVDLLAKAALHRSSNLTSAFITLARERNFMTAASLLRLQVDSCLRFYAVHLVDNCHDIATQMLNGKQINKIKAKDGNLLSDKYLSDKLSEKKPWVKNVYRETSGYIHLSEKHIYNIFVPNKDSDQNKFTMVIGSGDNFPDATLYLEMVLAYKAATETLFWLISGWIVTKDKVGKYKKQQT